METFMIGLLSLVATFILFPQLCLIVASWFYRLAEWIDPD